MKTKILYGIIAVFFITCLGLGYGLYQGRTENAAMAQKRMLLMAN